MGLLSSLIVGMALLIGDSVSIAHHSLAMFDASKQLQMTGTVREFQWTNPHSWLQLVVKAEDGSETEWSLECGSVNMMSRQGWKRSTFAAGEKLTVTLKPMKDGRPGGQFVSAQKADGSVVVWSLGGG